jgi:hypothetical protein
LISGLSSFVVQIEGNLSYWVSSFYENVWLSKNIGFDPSLTKFDFEDNFSENIGFVNDINPNFE